MAAHHTATWGPVYLRNQRIGEQHSPSSSFGVGGASRLAGPSSASADVFLNEIYFDSPSTDKPNEYIELRGTAGMSLANHYLVILENELGAAGQIDNVFNLGSRSLGANGFLLLRMKSAQHTGIAAGTTDLINTGTGSGRLAG